MMRGLLGLLLALAPHASLHAQVAPTRIVGWYNGDCDTALNNGWSNWYLSEQQFTRVYDEFVVPPGGWIVSSVFSNNQLVNVSTVTQAAWEIRSTSPDMPGGVIMASGVSFAIQTYVSALRVWRIEVSGLNVALTPGRYLLNVTPAGVAFRQSFVCQTSGRAAVGDPPGSGRSYYTASGSSAFYPFSGTGNTNRHFSQGVNIQPASLPAAAAWQRNFASLAQQMPRLHSVPYPGVTLEEFNAKADDLAARTPSLSEPEIRTGLEMLVASINDPHTYVAWPPPSPYRFLPITFYWFDEGIYVTAAAAAYGNILGGRVIAIGNVAIEDAIQRLTPLVAHDNDQWLKSVIPANKLTNADFLFATGITDNTEGADIQVELPSGEIATAYVSAGTTGPKVNVYQGDLPLYRQHPERNYWATFLDDGATVYFQYNACVEDLNQPWSAFQAKLDDMLAGDKVQRLIVDMRNNSGGFAFIDRWIAKIAAGRFNHPNRLYVIVGRATFSAAMEAADILHDTTSATFVGEPTGAKPRFLLHVGDLTLPYFGLRVTYSNGVEQAKDYGPALIPDIQTPVTFAGYMSGADPALDAILGSPLPD